MAQVTPDWRGTLVRTWLTTAITDFIFSSCLAVFAYQSTFARLWQGVASVPLGPSALEGGTGTTLIGLGLHFSVALTWSTIFVLVFWRSEWLRRVVSGRFGVVKAASVYGPAIWMFMSFVVIQSFTHRPPNLNYRWWIQFFGHIPFVAVPIVATASRPWRRAS